MLLLILLLILLIIILIVVIRFIISIIVETRGSRTLRAGPGVEINSVDKSTQLTKFYQRHRPTKFY